MGEEGGERAACRKPKVWLLARAKGVSNASGPEGLLHREGWPEDLLRHSRLLQGLFQALQIEAVVSLGNVQAHCSGLLAGCHAQAQDGGQHRCLDFGLLPVSDQQLRVLPEPRPELLGSDFRPR